MKNARIDNAMTYRCLSDLTGINITRLIKIEDGVEVPSEYESGKIKSILGNDISFPQKPKLHQIGRNSKTA